MSDLPPSLATAPVAPAAPGLPDLFVYDLPASTSNTAENLPDASKIELFNGENFKCWQEKVFHVLDVHNLVDYLQSSPPEEGTEDYDKKLQTWNAGNKVCMHTILNSLASSLCDIYYPYKNAYEIWALLKKKYMHKKKQVSFKDAIIHVRIEEKNRIRDVFDKAKKFRSNANLIKNTPQLNKKQSNPINRHPNNPKRLIAKKKRNCFVCGKISHYANQCRHKAQRKGDNKNLLKPIWLKEKEMTSLLL
ncbi:hypothetical protein CICLE_v10013762mg [Citrus x clementina]|uniref:CCHC-type domain-containing protein n=1 Tax=Citrus clementina TaxID=85681 RepID=V4SWF5_CITCL|nr:hypothetical protein CICLE_v10013762mg [Citrus x clementina]